MQLQGKIMNQTWENGKKSNFEPHLGPLWPKFGPQKILSLTLPLLDVRNCCKLSLYAISWKTWENDKKPSFGPDFGLFGSNLGHQFFSYKNLASSVARYHGQLLSCTISEKTNDPILRKLSDGWMARRTDWHTDREEWFHRRLYD